MMKYRLLLTTPDYPPTLGGLSTFAITIERILKQLDLNYELLVWNSISDLKKFRPRRKFDYVVNIHFMGGYFLKNVGERHINFFHGSEILFHSSNFFKNLYKKIFRRVILRYLERSYLDVFISKATQELLENKGYHVNYQRDIILHNCLEFDDNFVEVDRKIGDIVKFVCIARDVPHKNIDGCIKLVEQISKISGRKVELYITSDKSVSACGVKIINISGIPDEHREQIYRQVDFNLLLSLDHSNKGYIEGFGLTVLEAGQYGVPSVVLPNGGLVESVHHQRTGWIIKENEIANWWNSLNDESYSSICKQCYQHTRNSHRADMYRRLFERVLNAK